MKAVEFKAKIKNKSIRIPDYLSMELSDNKSVRAIVLLEESEYEEENTFKALIEEEFLNGYSDKDSVYDNY